MNYIFIYIWFIISISSVSYASLHDEHSDFFKSFIRNYGLSANSRDTREYHPYILSRAQASMDHMHHALVQAGFNLADRIIILGYQQDAIPDYYCSHSKTYIDDEVSIKNVQGWIHASGNLFGFITGYVLRDCNSIKQTVFEHIVPERVGLFDSRATLFARHAFGNAYQAIETIQSVVRRGLKKKSYNNVLHCLEALWNYLYVQQPLAESGTPIATQDILFSLEYVRSIIHNALPVRKCFVGPDITYPIMVNAVQSLEATAGAQACIPKVHEQLYPVNGQKTAYVLCSFVDGVGKSTLLGNLLSFKKYGTDFNRYQSVDNSSSLQASYVEYAPDVLLVDLPAQMSHYTIKPEGKVYVPIQVADGYSVQRLQLIQEYIAVNITHINAQLHNHDSPEYQYRQLCKQLQITTPLVPFHFENEHYLVHSNNYNDLHILVDLQQVHSKGLKVKQPERMLFSGVTIAQSAQSLTVELIDQFKVLKVQNIVFIDCMGMYPRSSRENIRLNFLLQQLTTIYPGQFVAHPCFYTGLVNYQELYKVLKDDMQMLCNSINKEATLRYFYQLLMDRYSGEQISIDTNHLHELLTMYLTQINKIKVDTID